MVRFTEREFKLPLAFYGLTFYRSNPNKGIEGRKRTCTISQVLGHKYGK